jgi:hypothetical protein
MGQYPVIAVAIVACGRDNQSPLEQAFPVDAFTVVFKDIMFRYIVNPGNRSALPMAFPTQERNIHFICAGLGRFRINDIVRSMALLAIRCVQRIQFQSLTVYTDIILLLGFIMAITAIHRFKVLRMGKFCNGGFCMAHNAFHIPVDRIGQQDIINVHRNRFPHPLRSQCRIFMAHQAILIALTKSPDGQKKQVKDHLKRLSAS